MCTLRIAQAASIAAMGTLVPALSLPARAEEAPTWSGLYFGVNAGFATTDISTNIDDGTSPLFGEPVTQSVEGRLGGIHAGLQHQIGPWVIGVEGSFATLDANATARETSQTFISGANFEETRSAALDDLVTVTGRLGYAWSPTFMTYVKGGWAQANVETTSSYTMTDPTTTITHMSSLSERHNGWTLGLGADMKLTDNVTFSLGYDYIKLEGITGEAPSTDTYDGVSMPGFASTRDVDIDGLHVVSARLSLRLDIFGVNAPAVPFKPNRTEGHGFCATSLRGTCW